MRLESQSSTTRRRANKKLDRLRPNPGAGDASALSRREVIEEHLLDVAAQRFAKAGYRQTTLEEVARHAGVAKASMYRYFENKQELLAKIFLKVVNAFTQAIQPLLEASLPPEEKLRQVVQHLLRTIGENVALFTVFYSAEADLPPKLRAEVTEARQRVVADLERLLQEGMAQGVFRTLDTKPTVLAILGMCAWLHKWYSPGEGRLDDICSAFVGLIERGCLATRGTEEKDNLADQLRHVQDLLGGLVEHAERLEQGGRGIRP